MRCRRVGAEKAVLSHESALALLGLSDDNIPGAVHVLVPRRHRGLRRPAGVVLHTRSDDEQVPIVWRDGLPLTAPARTLIDVVNDRQPEHAEMAVRQGLEGGFVSEAQLEREAAWRGQAEGDRRGNRRSESAMRYAAATGFGRR